MATLFLHHKNSHPTHRQYYNFRTNGQHPSSKFVPEGGGRAQVRLCQQGIRLLDAPDLDVVPSKSPNASPCRTHCQRPSNSAGNLNHLGVNARPIQVSISYGNTNRDWELFQDFCSSRDLPPFRVPSWATRAGRAEDQKQGLFDRFHAGVALHGSVRLGDTRRRPRGRSEST